MSEHPDRDGNAPGTGAPGGEVVLRGGEDVIDGSVADVVPARAVPASADRAPAPRRAAAPTRRDARVSPPRRHDHWLVNQLPVGMLGDDFFVRFVSLFQAMGDTVMAGADQIEHLADTTVTPTPLLPYLASWIDARTVDASLPEEVQRLILRSSARALALRGTRRGLQQYLQMLSGSEVEVVDGGGVWAAGDSPADPAWVRLQVGGTGHLSEDEFVALVRDEIPAHVRAELWIGGRRVLSTETDGEA